MCFMSYFNKDKLINEFLWLLGIFFISIILIHFVFKSYFGSLSLEITVEGIPFGFPPIGVIISLFAILSYLVMGIKALKRKFSDEVTNVFLLIINMFMVLEFSGIAKILLVAPVRPMPPKGEELLNGVNEIYFAEHVEFHLQRLRLLSSAFTFIELLLIVSLVGVAIANGICIAKYRIDKDSMKETRGI